MEENKCSCHGKEECALCPDAPRWCETCRRAVADKRCPYCGMKTRQRRPSEAGNGRSA